jgi:hypothetical protein
MNSRLARRLTLLYPKAWRDRYGDEFVAFLQEHPATFDGLLDIIIAAVRERFRSPGEHAMSKPQHALILMAYAWIAAVAGGMNLSWTVDDNPLAGTMRSHPPMFMCWIVVEAGALMALASVVLAGLPLLLAALRFAFVRRRGDILRRLAFAPCAAATLLVWMTAVLVWDDWRWAPVPSAITGKWHAPAEWPPVDIRWILGSITLGLLIAAFVGSAITFRGAIRRSGFPEHRLTFLGHVRLIQPLAVVKVPALLFAGSVVAMAVGVLGWGLFAQQYAAVLFHDQWGGVLNASSFVSWLISAVLFVVSAAAAVCSARWIMASNVDSAAII